MSSSLSKRLNSFYQRIFGGGAPKASLIPPRLPASSPQGKGLPPPFPTPLPLPSFESPRIKLGTPEVPPLPPRNRTRLPVVQNYIYASLELCARGEKKNRLVRYPKFSWPFLSFTLFFRRAELVYRRRLSKK